MKAGFVVVSCVALSLAGCATVTRGMTEQVSFTSEPAGATVQTSTGLRCAATPCTFDISRKSEFVASFTLAGYEDQEIKVVTELAGNGAAGFAGNVLIGGVVGMGTDAATGATQDHKPNPVHAVMMRKSTPVGPIKRHKPKSSGTTADS